MNYKLINELNDNLSPIEQVLHNRGITDTEHYLNTDILDILDPLLINNMEKGAKMLI